MTLFCTECGQRFDHLPADAICTDPRCQGPVLEGRACDTCDGLGHLIIDEPCDECAAGLVPADA